MISPAASGWKFRGARVFVASTRGEGRRFGTPVFAARRKDEEEKDLEEKKRRGEGRKGGREKMKFKFE